MTKAEDPGIGTRVREARERLGWSREMLAVESGVSWSGIAQIESGRRTKLRAGTLSGLAQALGVTIDYLARGGPASPAMLEHAALLYDTDEDLVQTAGPFLTAGVERSEAVMVVTSAANSERLREHLGSDAQDVEFLDVATMYPTPTSALNAYKAFSTAKLAAGARWVRILGELIWEESSDAEIRRWMRYESLFNLVFAAWPMTVACLYDEGAVHPEIARQARLTHPHTIGRAGTAVSPDYADPGGFAFGEHGQPGAE
jgi:transcriptional regulator with XRE-family HTH domain